jgi:hypothetical protein
MMTKTTVNVVSLYDLITNNLMLIIAIIYYIIVLYTNNNYINLLNELIYQVDIKEFKWLETIKIITQISQNIHFIEIIIIFIFYNFTFNSKQDIQKNNSTTIILNWYIWNIIITLINEYYLIFDDSYSEYTSLNNNYEKTNNKSLLCNKFPNNCYQIEKVHQLIRIFCLILFIGIPLYFVLGFCILYFIDLYNNYFTIIVNWCKNYKIEIISKTITEENNIDKI